MKGFREFLLRGNLVELAVAVVIGTAFTAVVTRFTAMLMDVVGLVGRVPDFSSQSVYGISVGAFLTALLSFLLTAAVVYFGVVLPYNRVSERLRASADSAAAAPAVTSEDLLTEIRDLLRAQVAAAPPAGPRSSPGP